MELLKITYNDGQSTVVIIPDDLESFVKSYASAERIEYINGCGVKIGDPWHPSRCGAADPCQRHISREEA